MEQVQNSASRSWSLSQQWIFQGNRNWPICSTAIQVRCDEIMGSVLIAVQDNGRAQWVHELRECHTPYHHLEWADSPNFIWNPYCSDVQRSAWESLVRSPPGSCDPCLAEENDPARHWISAGVCHHHSPFGSPCPSQTTRACDQYRSGLCIQQQGKGARNISSHVWEATRYSMRPSGRLSVMARRSQVSFGGVLTASQLPSSKNVSTGTQAYPSMGATT